MPINTYQLERLNIIHELLQNGGRFTSEALVTCLTGRLEKIRNEDGREIKISKRTLINDINYMRSKGAPIPERAKVYHYRKGEPFSFLDVLGQKDNMLLEEMKGIVGKLQALTKVNQLINVDFDEFALKISDPSAKIVLFDNTTENLLNNELIPKLFENIQNKQVLSIKYRDFKNNKFEDILHPYLLKEYNGRWYLYGLSEIKYGETGSKTIMQYPIDRIRDAKPIEKKRFWKNNWWDYEKHFSEMVGVSRDIQKPIRIEVRIYGSSVDYLSTKKIHQSQNIVIEEDDYTDFEFLVIDNYEFRSKILALGLNAEVLQPLELREDFAKITKEMAEKYINL